MAIRVGCEVSTPADIFFSTRITFELAETSIENAIEECCGLTWQGDGEAWTADGYDNSIEVYGVGDDVNLDESASNLADMCGFALVWLHRHSPPRGMCKCPVRGPRSVK